MLLIIITASYWMLHAVVIAKEDELTVHSEDFCDYEDLKLSCAPASFIVITSAFYGRMAIGRCATRNYGYIGCKRNVTADVDYACSGLARCQMAVISFYDETSFCPRDLRSFLKVTYICHKTSTPVTHECSSPDQFPVFSRRGSLVPYHQLQFKDTGPGRTTCPYRITAEPYQFITLTVDDIRKFVRATSSPTARANTVINCTELGYIIEYNPSTDGVGVQRNSTDRKWPICAEYLTQGTEYKSISHSIDIVFNSASEDYRILVTYQANGCATPETPLGGYVIINSSSATILCHFTSESWSLICQGSDWIGHYSNCSNAYGCPMPPTPPGAHVTLIDLGKTALITCNFTKYSWTYTCEDQQWTGSTDTCLRGPAYTGALERNGDSSTSTAWIMAALYSLLICAILAVVVGVCAVVRRKQKRIFCQKDELKSKEAGSPEETIMLTFVIHQPKAVTCT